MSAPALALAFVLGALPLAVDLGLAEDGPHRLSIACVVWAALAGAPRLARRGVPTVVAVAAAAPTLALAARLEVAAGLPLGEAARAALLGALLVALLAAAADAARARGAALHGWLWLALVLAPPGLDLALGTAGGGLGDWPGRTPLGYLAASDGAVPAGPLLVGAALLAAARLGPRGEAAPS